MTDRCKALIALYQRTRIMTRSQLIMRALTGQQRPNATLAPALVRSAISALSVAIPVVAATIPALAADRV